MNMRTRRPASSNTQCHLVPVNGIDAGSTSGDSQRTIRSSSVEQPSKRRDLGMPIATNPPATLQPVVLSSVAKTLARAACALSFIPFLFAACDSASPKQTAQAGTGGASTGGDAQTGGNLSSVTVSGGTTGIDISGSTAGTSSNDIQACATDDTPAMPVPLDIFLMLDISGSMLDPTAAGIPKWDAIKNALTSFLQDSGSDEISVGIQYFPLRKPGVPASCASNAECGAGGPCTLSRCTQYGTLIPNGIAVCESDADCAAIPTAADYGPCSAGICAGDATRSCTAISDCQVAASFDYGPCAEIGYCALAPTVACAPNTECGPGADGVDRGNCVAATASYCFHGIQCDQTAYATPAVEIAAIPGATPALVESLSAQTPEGDTPSAPALRGALQHARDWAESHPQHTVVAVLATDGLPTECLPDDIRFSGTRTSEDLLNEVEAIAAEGTRAPPGISTFVIGVFGSADQQAPANLERIAQAGGTERAQIVDTAGDVSMQFLSALNAVRASQLQCEFLIPSPSSGEKLNYFLVNIIYTEEDVETALPYVGTVDQCDPVQGGWYYDDGAGISPTKILVCPSNCEAFKASTGSIQIALGCTTIVK